MNKPIKHVKAGEAPSIAHPEVANEIIDAVNAFAYLESDPPDLVKNTMAGGKAVLEFATETIIVVKDGIPTLMEFVGFDLGPAVDENPL